MAAVVSIIIPCYNYGHLLGDALNSLRRQEFQRWECIVVDDGSEDNTREIAYAWKELDARVRYMHQENSGLSAARNVGIRAARGEFIQFLDADDVLEPEKLGSQVAHLAENPETDVAYGLSGYFRAYADGHVSSGRGPVDFFRLPRPSGQGWEVLSILVRENFLAVHAALLRRSVLDAVGRFDESFKACEDWEFWLRCALAGKRFNFVKADDARALVRVHQGNMTLSQVLMEGWQVRLRTFIEPRLPFRLREENYELRCRAQLRLGLALTKEGRLGEGGRQITKAIAASKRKLRTLSQLALVMIPPRAAARLKGRLGSLARG